MSGSTRTFVDTKIARRKIMVFAKSNDPDSKQAKQILDQYFLPRGSFFLL